MNNEMKVNRVFVKKRLVKKTYMGNLYEIEVASLDDDCVDKARAIGRSMNSPMIVSKVGIKKYCRMINIDAGRWKCFIDRFAIEYGRPQMFIDTHMLDEDNVMFSFNPSQKPHILVDWQLIE